MNGERRPNRSEKAAPRYYSAAKYTPAQCPDSGAVQTGAAFQHEPTCPVWVGVNRASDDDARWFRQHPDRKVRERRITPAEQAEFEMSLGWQPTGVVVVIQAEPGKRVRYVTDRSTGRA